ncbi:hypothetical protein, partial [Helicobacter ganmani]|uniref:hypothetical protein n=2 Tax=Helicobacter ganmani TaxID=60246 RepID=UPI003A89F709
QRFLFKNTIPNEKEEEMKELAILFFLIPNFILANPIDSMNDKLLQLRDLSEKQNTSIEKNKNATINTLTQKQKSLFLLKQSNELILIEHKIGAVNGK